MVRVRLAVDRHKIGPDVTVAVIVPLAGQSMILVTPRQLAVRLIVLIQLGHQIVNGPDGRQLAAPP